MCGGDCGSKHQVMLDTIASLNFKLNEANELLNLYRESEAQLYTKCEEMTQEIERLQRSLLLYRDPDAYVSAVTRERILPL